MSHQSYQGDAILRSLTIGNQGLRLSNSDTKITGTLRFNPDNSSIECYTGTTTPNGNDWHRITLPVASSSEHGVIKTGSNLTITSSGTLSSIAEGESRLNQNVITVSHILGKADYQTITAAISFINDLTTSSNSNAPSPTNPFLIVVSPGVYTESITIPDYVSLQGETAETTIIKSITGASSIADSAVVTLGTQTRLERIKIQHTGGNDTYCLGIYISNQEQVVLSDLIVEVNSSSSDVSTNAYCLYASSVADFKITNSEFTIPYGASSGTNYGLYLQGSSPKINYIDLNISSTSNSISYGLYTYVSADAIITNSRVSVIGATTNYTHYNNESSPEIRACVYISDTYGLYNVASDYLASVISSSVIALTHTTGTTLDTITRSSGSFISDGFEANREIKVTGAGNSRNNNTFLVTKVTSTTLTLSQGDLVTSESVGGSITIRQLHTVNIYESRINGTTSAIGHSGSTGYFSTHIVNARLEGGSSVANNSLLTFDDYQTIIVAQEGGDFHRLGEALDSISDNGLYRKYQIIVRAGTYYETSQITFKEYVKITGSGREITKIMIDPTSAGVSGASLASESAFLVGASNLEISDIAFENINSANSGYSLGFYGSSLTNLVLNRIAITVGTSGSPDYHFGCYLNATTDFIIDDFKVIVSGGVLYNQGLMTLNTTGDISRMIMTVSGASSNYNYGLHGDRSNLTVEGSKITVSGSSGSNRAIMTTNTSSTEYCIQVFNSNIVSDDYSLYTADNQIIVASGCQLNGERYYNTTDGSDSLLRTIGCYQITGTTDKTYSAIGLTGGTVESSNGSISIGEGAGNPDSTGTGNTNIGINSGGSNTTGSENSNLGNYAGSSNTTGSNNTFLGSNAGKNNTTGSGLTYVGRNAGLNSTTGSSSTHLGHGAGQSATTASRNLFLGEFSGNQISTGSDNAFGGYLSGFHGTTANKNVIFGGKAGQGITTASGDVIIGYQSGNQIASGSQSVIIGRSAGELTTTGNNTIVGSYASANNTTGTELTIYGHQASFSGTTGSFNSVFGSKAGYSLTTGTSNFLGGYRVGYSLTTGARNVCLGSATSSNTNSAGHGLTTASDNIFIGQGSGKSTTTGATNIAIGTDALNNNISGTKNICMGQNAGNSSTSANNNIFMGYNAGTSNTTGDNIAIGVEAGSSTSGQYTIFMGSEAGRYSVGSHNMALGVQAGKNQTQGTGTGANNLFIGNYAGHNIQTGNRNICLGSGTNSGGIKGSGGSLTSGSDNIIMGYLAAQGINADSNVIIGTRAGFTATAGNRNVLMGTEAGYSSTTGSQNSFIGYQSGYSNTTGSDNFCLGYQSGYSLTTATRNVFIGTSAGQTSTTRGKSVGIGYQAGYNSNSSGSVFLGYYAGRSLTSGQSNIFIGFQTGMGGIDIDQSAGTPTNLTGDFNVFMGYRAGFTNTTGDRNLLVGYNAGFSNTTGAKNIMMGDNVGYSNTTGSQNIFIGTGAGDSGSGAGFSNTTGDFNLFLGYEAGRSNTTGSYNLALGAEAGRSLTTGLYNICAGFQAGYSATTSSFNIYMGFDAGYNNTTGQGNIIMGYKAGRSGSSATTYANCIIIGREAGFGNDASDNIFIGQLAGFKNTTGSNNLCVGSKAGQNNIIGDSNVFIGNLAGQNSTSSSNVCIGFRAGATNTSGDSNICIGANAGFANATGSNNIFLGKGAGQNTTSSQNIFFGAEAGQSNLSGSKNIYFGYRAGKTALGSNNMCIGAETGSSLTTGGSNVFIGYQSGFNTDTGASNFFMGYQSGYSNTSGNTNIYIGYQAGYTNDSGSKNLAIGYKTMKYAVSNVDSCLAIGKFSLINNLFGSRNIALGYDTLSMGNVGDNNIVIGPESSFVVRNTGFTGNVSVGYKANFHGFATDNSVIMGPNALDNGAGGQYNIILGRGAAPKLGLGSDPYTITSGDNIEAGNSAIIIRNSSFVKKGQHISLVKVVSDEDEHETFYVTSISENTVNLSSSLGFNLSVNDNVYLTYGTKSTTILNGTSGNSYITVITPKNDAESLFNAGDKVTIQDLNTTNQQTATIVSFEINTGTTTTGTTKINLDSSLTYSFTSGDVLFFARQRSLLLGELDSSTASANVIIGPETGNNITLASKCIAIGDRAMFNNVSGDYIMAFGTEAAYYAKAPFTTAIGTRAGYYQDFTSTGSGKNTYVGYRAGYFCGFSGPANNNMILGNNAGQINDGCGNIFIGTETLDVESNQAVGATTYDNKLAIYKSTGGVPSNPILGGDLALGRLGVKTISPKSALDIAGSYGTAINTFTQDATIMDYSANYTLYWDKIDTSITLESTTSGDFLERGNLLVNKEILNYRSKSFGSSDETTLTTLNHGSFQTIIAHHANQSKVFNIGAVKFRRELTSNVNNSSSALTANSISNFNSSGLFSLGSEIIHYTGTGGGLGNVTRGRQSTNAVSHTSGDKIFYLAGATSSLDVTRLTLAINNSQTTLPVNTSVISSSNSFVLIDSEIIKIVDNTTYLFNVTRGTSNSTATSHLSGASGYIIQNSAFALSETTLSSNFTVGDDIIRLTSFSETESTSGYLIIEEEILKFDNVALTGLTRAMSGSTNQGIISSGNRIQLIANTVSSFSTTSTLDGSISSIQTTLTLDDASGFSNSGVILIESELISYSSKTVNILTGLVRGLSSTTLASHDDGITVRKLGSSIITSGITATSANSTHIKFASGHSSFTSSGTVLIGTELIGYTNLYSVGITPGIGTTDATGHSIGNRVWAFSNLGQIVSLSSGINNSTTTIDIDSNSGFPNAGNILIGGEVITFSNGSGIDNIVRGSWETTSVAHSLSGYVYYAPSLSSTNTTLTAGVIANDTTIPSLLNTFMASAGTIAIGAEIITYANKNTIDGLSRGYNGTTAITHYINTSDHIYHFIPTSVVTTLASNMSATVDSMYLNNITEFPSSGKVLVQSTNRTAGTWVLDSREIISYTGKNNSLAGLTRGTNSTVASSHTSGDIVYQKVDGIASALSKALTSTEDGLLVPNPALFTDTGDIQIGNEIISYLTKNQTLSVSERGNFGTNNAIHSTSDNVYHIIHNGTPLRIFGAGINNPMTNSDTHFAINISDLDTSSLNNSGDIRIDGEIVHWRDKNQSLVGKENNGRGYIGSTSANHNSGASVYSIVNGANAIVSTSNESVYNQNAFNGITRQFGGTPSSATAGETIYYWYPTTSGGYQFIYENIINPIDTTIILSTDSLYRTYDYGSSGYIYFRNTTAGSSEIVSYTSFTTTFNGTTFYTDIIFTGVNRGLFGTTPSHHTAAHEDVYVSTNTGTATSVSIGGNGGSIYFENGTLNTTQFNSVGIILIDTELITYTSRNTIESDYYASYSINTTFDESIILESPNITTISASGDILIDNEIIHYNKKGNTLNGVDRASHTSTRLAHTTGSTVNLVTQGSSLTLNPANTDTLTVSGDFIPFASGTSISSSGYVRINKEIVHYNKTNQTLSTTIRGSNGTSTSGHTSGAQVYELVISSVSSTVQTAMTTDGSDNKVINLADATNYNASGNVLINGEVIHYNFKGKSLTNLTRGYSTTDNTTHSSGDMVYSLTRINGTNLPYNYTFVNTILTKDIDDSTTTLYVDGNLIDNSGYLLLTDSSNNREIIKYTSNQPVITGITRATNNTTGMFGTSGTTLVLVRNDSQPLPRGNLITDSVFPYRLESLTRGVNATSSLSTVNAGDPIIYFSNSQNGNNGPIGSTTVNATGGPISSGDVIIKLHVQPNIIGGWSQNGYAILTETTKGEIIHYSSISGYFLTGLTRGQFNTSPNNFTIACKVFPSDTYPKILTTVSYPSTGEPITFTENQNNIGIGFPNGGYVFTVDPGVGVELAQFQSVNTGNECRVQYEPYFYNFVECSPIPTNPVPVRGYYISNHTSVKTTTLSANFNSSHSYILVGDANGILSNGFVILDNSIYKYGFVDSMTGNLQGVTRDMFGTTASLNVGIGSTLVYCNQISEISLGPSISLSSYYPFNPGNTSLHTLVNGGTILTYYSGDFISDDIDTTPRSFNRVSLNGKYRSVISGGSRGELGTLDANYYNEMRPFNWINGYSSPSFITTTCNGDFAAGNNQLKVIDYSDFPDDGYLLIESEIVYYSGKIVASLPGGATAFVLSIPTSFNSGNYGRGINLTNDVTHSSGTTIRYIGGDPPVLLYANTINSNTTTDIAFDYGVGFGGSSSITSSGLVLIGDEVISYKFKSGYNPTCYPTGNTLYAPGASNDIWSNTDVIIKNDKGRSGTTYGDGFGTPNIPFLVGRGLDISNNLYDLSIDSYSGTTINLSSGETALDWINIKGGFLLIQGFATYELGGLEMTTLATYNGIDTFNNRIEGIKMIGSFSNCVYDAGLTPTFSYLRMSDAITNYSDMSGYLYQFSNQTFQYNANAASDIEILDTEYNLLPLHSSIQYFYLPETTANEPMRTTRAQSNGILAYSGPTRGRANSTIESVNRHNNVLVFSQLTPFTQLVSSISNTDTEITLTNANSFTTSGIILLAKTGNKELITYTTPPGLVGVTRGQLNTTGQSFSQGDSILNFHIATPGTTLRDDIATDNGTSSYASINNSSSFSSNGMAIITSSGTEPEIVSFAGRNSLDTLTRAHIGSTQGVHGIGTTAYKLNSIDNHSTLRKNVSMAGSNLPLADATNYDSTGGFVLIGSEIIQYGLKNSIDELSGNQFITESFTDTSGSIRHVSSVTGHSTLRTDMADVAIDTRVHLTSGVNYGTSGLVIIDGEMIIYNTRNSIDTLDRAQYGTISANHNTINAVFLTSVTAHSTLKNDVYTNSQGVFPLNDASAYPSSGYVLIDTEYLNYRNKNSLDDLIRAQYGTTAIPHSNASTYTSSGYTVQQLTSVLANSTLRTAMGENDFGVPLNSTANFTNSGYVLINSEMIYYTNYLSLDNLTRGNYGTTASGYASGTGINQVTMNGYSTLRSDIISLDSTLPLVDASSYTSSGLVIIDGEYIDYTNKNTLDGLTRGIEGTSNTIHNNGGQLESAVFDITTPQTTANSGLIYGNKVFLSDDTTGIQLASSVDNFPNSGTITIGSEKIAFASRKGLTYLTRGTNNTVPTSHSNGVRVFLISDFVSTNYSLNSDSLLSSISSAATVIPLNSSANFANSGTVIVGSEIISYNNKVGNTLTECTRGRLTTTSSSYIANTKVIRSNAIAIFSTLTKEMDNNQRMLVLDNNDAFGNSGTVLIDGEIIYYEKKRGITTLTRASDSTTAAGYPNGTSVSLTDLTLDDDHSTVMGDTDSGNLEFDLPPASTCTGRQYVIKKIASSNSLVIRPSGVETIDGASTKTATTNNAFLTIQSDGTNWRIINWSDSSHWV